MKKNEHSEEYKKGYRVGYNSGYQRAQAKAQAEKTDVIDFAFIRSRGKWYHIEGDDETFVCPFCETHTYAEGDYIPKFCMECGAEMRGVEE